MMVTLAPVKDQSRVNAAQAFKARSAQTAALTSSDAAQLKDAEFAQMVGKAL